MGESRHFLHLRGGAVVLTCRPLHWAVPGPPSPVNAQETRFLRPRRYLLVTGLCALAAGILLAFGVGIATPEPAAIQAKRAQVAAIQAELAAIDAEVGRAAEAYNGARYELGQVKARIAANKRQIAGTEADLARSEKVLAKRLVDIYATPEPTLAEVIINSGSISAAADHMELLDQVGQQDAGVVKTLEESKARLEGLRVQLLANQEKVEAAVAQAAAYKDKVQGLLDQRAAVLEGVKGELAQMLRAEEARQRQIAAQAAALAQARQAAAAQTSAGGASAGGASASAPAASGAPASSTPLPSGDGNSAAVAAAMAQLGTPYVWGGGAPGGFDCSGLASWAYAQVGKSVPHYTGAIWSQFPKVGGGQEQPGDMVFFNGGGHMGIYIGGGQYVHAPHTGDVVKVYNLGERSDYMGAVRA
jgi:peptidoglycan DL-endopeptidase CwlO